MTQEKIQELLRIAEENGTQAVPVLTELVKSYVEEQGGGYSELLQVAEENGTQAVPALMKIISSYVEEEDEEQFRIAEENGTQATVILTQLVKKLVDKPVVYKKAWFSPEYIEDDKIKALDYNKYIKLEEFIRHRFGEGGLEIINLSDVSLFGIDDVAEDGILALISEDGKSVKICARGDDLIINDSGDIIKLSIRIRNDSDPSGEDIKKLAEAEINDFIFLLNMFGAASYMSDEETEKCKKIADITSISRITPEEYEAVSEETNFNVVYNDFIEQ